MLLQNIKITMEEKEENSFICSNVYIPADLSEFNCTILW